jgi:hypothetical protein
MSQEEADSGTAAAIVIKIAAGTKKIPTDSNPSTQPIHRSVRETILALRRLRNIGISETTTGNVTTTDIHQPLTAKPEAFPQWVTPPGFIVPHELYIGPNATASAPSTAAKDAAIVNRSALTAASVYPAQHSQIAGSCATCTRSWGSETRNGSTWASTMVST